MTDAPAHLVRTTYASEAEATRAGTALLEGGLACCVHIHPLTSLFRWEGRLRREQEWMLEARTVEADPGPAAAWLKASHPYETPLVEATSSQVSKEYAQWARSVEGPARPDGGDRGAQGR